MRRGDRRTGTKLRFQLTMSHAEIAVGVHEVAAAVDGKDIDGVPVLEEVAVASLDRPEALLVPAELDQALAGNRQAKAAFAQLTPGRQREYATYVAEAKREATRVGRTEKVIPMILAGVGLHDKYRNC